MKTMERDARRRVGRKEAEARDHRYEEQRRVAEAKLEEHDRANEEIEAAFVEAVPWPRLHFECSMVQTAVEDAEGVVTWRDVNCDDEDDYEVLWSREWLG